MIEIPLGAIGEQIDGVDSDVVGVEGLHHGRVVADVGLVLASRAAKGAQVAEADGEPTHLEAGIVEPSRAGLSESRRFITIRSSEKRPDNATVRIRYRDWWFYIDATDTQSKRAFMFLRVFIGMRLADPGATQNAPVITIPVS
jgi:hypothetical protein